MSTRDWIEVCGWVFSAGVTLATWKFHGMSARREISKLKQRVQELEFCLGADTLSAARTAFRQREILAKIAEMLESLLRRKKRG